MTTQFLSTNDFIAANKPQLFEKRTVAELSADEMMQIDGGTTPVCAAAIWSTDAPTLMSAPCVLRGWQPVRNVADARA